MIVAGCNGIGTKRLASAVAKRLDVEFEGLLAGSHDEQSIAHTFNHTLSEGVGMAWDVDLTRISGTSTLTANYSGSADSGTFMASDYYRTFEATDIVIPEGEVDIHWTRTRQTGVYRYDDFMGFGQRQDWDSGVGDGGYRDGEGNAADYNGGAFAGDAGDYNGNPFGDVWANNQVVESGNADPIAFTVDWASSNTISMIEAPPSGMDGWELPGIAIDSDSTSAYSNQFSVYAIRAHKAFATEQRFHTSKLTRDVEDELVTSHSAGASGSHGNSDWLSLWTSRSHSGSTSVSQSDVYSGADYTVKATGIAQADGAVDGQLKYTDRATWRATQTWTQSGVATVDLSSTWSQTNYASRSQYQEVEFAMERNGAGSAHYTAPSYTSTHYGGYHDDLARGGYVQYTATASVTRTPSNPAAGWTTGGNVRDREASVEQSTNSDYFWSVSNAGVVDFYGRETQDYNRHDYTSQTGSAKDSMTTSVWHSATYDDAPYSDVGSSSSSNVFATPYVFAVPFPTIGSPIGPALAAAILKPPINDNLAFLEEHPELTEKKGAKEALLGDKVGLKGAGQGGEFDQLGAASKLDRSPATTREGANHPAEANAALQASAIAAETDKPKTGSQADRHAEVVSNENLTNQLGSNGGNPKAIDPGKNSGQAKVTTGVIEVRPPGVGNRFGIDDGLYWSPKPGDSKGAFDRNRDVIEIDQEGNIIRGIDDFDISADEKARLKERVRDAEKRVGKFWKWFYAGTTGVYAEAGFKVRVVKRVKDEPREPKTNREAVVRGVGEALGEAALIGGAIWAGGSMIGAAAGGIAISPVIAIAGGGILIGIGVYGAGNAVYEGIHNLKKAETPADVKAGARQATSGALGLLAFLGSVWAAVSKLGPRIAHSPSGKAVGFAKGTAQDAVKNIGRVDHAGEHLSDVGVIPGSKGAAAFRSAVRDAAIAVLENPIKTFDDVLRGDLKVKGFYGKVNGKDVVFFVAKADQGKIKAGDLVTAIVPSTQQKSNWGL